MDKEIKKKLKTQSKSMKPFLIIGKNGFNDNSIENIVKYLKANKLTKIKIAKSYTDNQNKTKKEIAQIIAQKTNSELIDVIGQIIVLYKR